MTSGNSPVWEREVQELNMCFLLIKWSVHIWLCARVRNMDVTSLVQLMVKTVQSINKTTHYCRWFPSGHNKGFQLRLGESPCSRCKPLCSLPLLQRKALSYLMARSSTSESDTCIACSCKPPTGFLIFWRQPVLWYLTVLQFPLVAWDQIKINCRLLHYRE